MSVNGRFEIDDADIVSLKGRLDGESDGRERVGWVNVGAFSVRVELDREGDATVSLFPCGNEDKPFGTISATRQEALGAGAIDEAASDGDGDEDDRAGAGGVEGEACGLAG